jgi:hypothetical protein
MGHGPILPWREPSLEREQLAPAEWLRAKTGRAHARLREERPLPGADEPRAAQGELERDAAGVRTPCGDQAWKAHTRTRSQMPFAFAVCTFKILRLHVAHGAQTAVTTPFRAAKAVSWSYVRWRSGAVCSAVCAVCSCNLANTGCKRVCSANGPFGPSTVDREQEARPALACCSSNRERPGIKRAKRETIRGNEDAREAPGVDAPHVVRRLEEHLKGAQRRRGHRKTP